MKPKLKKTVKKLFSAILLACFLVNSVPLNALAMLGATQTVADALVLSNMDVPDGDLPKYKVFNDYIQLMVAADNIIDGKRFTIATLPAKTAAGKTLKDAVNKDKIYQELYFTVNGTEAYITSYNVKPNQSGGDHSLEVNVTFGPDRKTEKYKAELRFSLEELDNGFTQGASGSGMIYDDASDNGKTWGARIVANISYINTPSYTYNFKGEHVQMHMRMVNFAKTGHPGASSGAGIYMNTAVGSTAEGFTHTATALPGGVSGIKTNVRSNYNSTIKDNKYEAITEVNTQGFSWANPFAATSSLYESYVDGFDVEFDGYMAGSLPSSFSTGSSGDLTLDGDYAELLGTERRSYATSMLWGFRDLYAEGDAAFTPSDKVTVSVSAKHLGIYPQVGGGYKAVPAAGNAELIANSRKYGEPVAEIRGEYKEHNGRYVFTSGVAALSPSVTAVWGSGGELSVGKDGSVTVIGVSLNCPTFKFYNEKGSGTPLTLTVTENGIEAAIDADNNSAKIALDIPNSEAKVTGAVIEPDGKVSFGGSVSFALFKNGSFDINELSYEMKSGAFKMNGIRAEGEIESIEMLGLEMGNVKGEIDTIDEKYAFSLELNVFDLFETEAELELKRAKYTGDLLPNKIYFYAGSEVAKIPLVPPVVVAHISGAGGGFDGLADTVNGDFFAIPPINFTITGRGDVLNVVEAKASYTLGPAYFKFEAEDIEFFNTDLVDEFMIYEGIRGETRNYGGKSYTGLNAMGGAKIHLAVPKKSKVIQAGGEVNAGVFAGLDSYRNPTKVYATASLTGKISGSINVPSDWPIIGGEEIAGTSLDFYMGASSNPSVSGGFDKAVESAFKSFKIYGGVMKQYNWKIADWRVWYLFPENDVGFKIVGFWDDLPEWNWEEKINPACYSVLSEDDGAIAVANINLNSVETNAVSFYSAGTYTKNVSLSASAGASLPSGSTMSLMVTPKSAVNMEAFAASLSVSKGGTPLVLTYPAYNEEGAITNESDINAIITKNGKGEDCVLIGLGEGTTSDEWTVTTDNADFDAGINASAPLDTLSAELSGYSLAASVANPSQDAEYVLLTYLGSKKGEGEQLVAETAVSDFNSINVTVPHEGTTLATGSYYVTAKLMRKETVSVLNSETNAEEPTEVLLPVDTVELGSVAYTNTVQPAAPAAVTINPAGNEVMHAEWSEVSGADGYRVKIYQQKNGEYIDTGKGYTFDIDDIANTEGVTYNSGSYLLDMALTVAGNDLAVDENGNSKATQTGSALEADKDYKISVEAYKYLTDGGKKVENSQIYSAESFSNAGNLPKYKPVKISKVEVGYGMGDMSAAALDEQTGIYRSSVKDSSSCVVSVSTEEADNVECKITRTDTDAMLTGADGYYDLTTSDFDGAVTLRIDVEKKHTGYSDITTGYLIIEKDNTAPVLVADSAVVYADKNTGKFNISGASEVGAKVAPDGENTAATVNESGRFTYSGSLDISNGETGTAVTLTATDAAGNKSEPATVLVALKDSSQTNYSQGGGSSSEEPVFSDVSENSYYYDAVMWAAKNGIAAGIDGKIFAPNTGCTRAQIISFIWRAEGSPAPVTKAVPFTDIDPDSYYAQAVMWAFENNIASGVSADRFDPDGVCTRAQAIAFLCRAGGSYESDAAHKFKDVDPNIYYAQAVRWGVENGIVSGVTETAFKPNQECTRAQIVSFLYRMNTQ